MLRKSSRNYYLKGGWNVICDRCGFKKKNTEVKLEWDNLLVCKDGCWEPRQPQDYVRAVPDMKPVPMARPEAPDEFVDGPITPGEIIN
jgi:hypothetical protein